MKKTISILFSVDKRFVLITVFSLLTVAGFAQLPLVRTTFNAPFVPINSGASNGGTLSTAVGDDVTQNNLPIGFTFNYLGNPYTTMGVSTNGWASFLGSLTGSQNSNLNLYTTTGPNLSVGPWWDDLTSDSIVYMTTGAPGNQVFTIQWNAKSYYTGASQLLTFQLKLFETTDVIEFHYGSIVPGTNDPTSESASIGLENSVGGAGNYLDAITGSAFAGTAFLSAPTKWPTRYYRFTPGTPTPLPGGTYNVGVGQIYPTIDEAIADLNHRGVAGSVTLSLTQNIYDITPVNGDNIFPVFISKIAGVSSTNSIVIQPASGTSTFVYDGAGAGSGIAGSSTSAYGTASEPIIGLVGASFITVQNLVLTTSTSSGNLIDRGVSMINMNAASGSMSNTVRDVTVALNRSNTSSLGFEIRTAITPTVATGANSGNKFMDVSIGNVYNGVIFTGNAAFPDLGNQITTSSPTVWNSIGGTNANDIGNGTSASYGIQSVNQSSVVINNNIIQNLTVSGSVVSDGILLTGTQGTSLVHNNKIQNIRNNSATATSGVTGIRASGATTGTHELRIYNNFVSGLTSGYSGAVSGTRQIKGIFAQAAGGGATTQTINVVANNVSINASSSPNISSTAYEIGTSSGPVINTRNNVFANFSGAQVSPAQHLTWYSTSATLVGNTGSSSNYNDLFIADATEGYIGRGNTTLFALIGAWQTAMNQDANSISCNPGYVSLNDLHVTSVCLDGAGNLAAYPWLTTDIDNTPRSVTPDIGADEYNLCSTVVAGTPSQASVTICQGQGATLNVNGSTVAGGVTYSWLFSTTPGGPYLNATGSGSTTTSYNTGTLSTGNYYFVMNVVCAANSATATTNEVTVTVNPYPVVSLSPSSSTICVPGGGSVSITASGANTYTWLPVSGLSFSTGATVNALPSSSTIYTVTGSALGCSSTATTGIAISLGVTMGNVSATPSVICSGLNSTITAMASQPFSYCQPAYTDGTVDGDYISGVSLNGLNNTTGPLAAPYYTLYPEALTTTTLTAGSTYSIFIIAGTWATNAVAAWIDFNNNGDFTDLGEKLGEVTGLGAAPATATMVFTVPVGATNGKLRLRVRELWNGTNISPCAQGGFGEVEDYEITITGGVDAFSYSWTPATFLSSTSMPTTISQAATATTIYSVTATAANGCSATSDVTLTVNALPVVSVNNGTICSGNSFTIIPTGAVSYTYMPSGPVVSPTANDTYTVTGEDANGCVSAAVISTVNVNAIPVLSVSATSGTICEGGSTALNVTGASSYTWSNGANTAITAVTPSVTMTYTVDGETLGCVGSETIQVNVNSLPSVSLTASTNTACTNGPTISLTGSPAGGVYTGTNVSNGSFNPGSTAGSFMPAYSYVDPSTGCSNSASVTIVVSVCTDISKTNSSLAGLQVYPNPNTGMFTIELNNGSVKNIVITDLTGRVIVSEITSSDKTLISLNNFANGVYFVRIMSNNAIETVRVIKQ